MLKEHQTILVFFRTFNLFYDDRVRIVHHREFKIRKKAEEKSKSPGNNPCEPELYHGLHSWLLRCFLLASQRRCPGRSLASTEDGVSPLEQESFSKFYLNFVWKNKKGGFATKDQKKG